MKTYTQCCKFALIFHENDVVLRSTSKLALQPPDQTVVFHQQLLPEVHLQNVTETQTKQITATLLHVFAVSL